MNKLINKKTVRASDDWERGSWCQKYVQRWCVFCKLYVCLFISSCVKLELHLIWDYINWAELIRSICNIANVLKNREGRKYEIKDTFCLTSHTWRRGSHCMSGSYIKSRQIQKTFEHIKAQPLPWYKQQRVRAAQLGSNTNLGVLISFKVK